MRETKSGGKIVGGGGGGGGGVSLHSENFVSIAKFSLCLRNFRYNCSKFFFWKIK